MKIKFLIASLLGVVSVAAYAQKGELSNAQEAYTKYSTFIKAAPALAAPYLKTAKTSIDKAAANVKTAAMAQTYALEAAIYSNLAMQDSVKTTSAPLLAISVDAAAKAKQADTKNEFKSLLDETNLNMAQYYRNEGVSDYRAAKYDVAYTEFDKYRQLRPDDTNAVYFSGLSAANAKNYTAALANYNTLVTMKYSNSAAVYYDMSNLYLANKDTTGALKSVSEGIAKFPANSSLRNRQIELYLRMGRQQEVLTQIEAALVTDPKNKFLYYYEGITYSKEADAIAKAQGKLKDQAAKDKLEQVKLENYQKAVDASKKALEIDPNFFDANFYAGYALLCPALDTYNSANQLPGNQQKQYDAMMAKASSLFDNAKPYLLKAVELNPKSPDALANLKTYYVGKKDMANANDVQKKIDALK
jgi:hypothetical protein